MGGEPVIESIAVREISDDEEAVRLKEKNIHRFNAIMEEEHVKAHIHAERGAPAGDLIGLSRYADIIVVDAATSFSVIEEETPTRFVKDILQEAECPVIIPPAEFNGIDSIVFCDNGSKSSAFAMKQFTYLLPELRDRRAKIIYLNGANDNADEEQVAVTDWLKYYYSDIEFIPMEEDVTAAFFNYLLKKKNDLVVMGAYGRGLLASFFENEIDKDDPGTTSLPIFITHY